MRATRLLTHLGWRVARINYGEWQTECASGNAAVYLTNVLRTCLGLDTAPGRATLSDAFGTGGAGPGQLAQPRGAAYGAVSRSPDGVHLEGIQTTVAGLPDLN